MQEEGLKLSQIVTDDELRDRHLSQMHTLGNSLLRSYSRNDSSIPKISSNYECRLPEVGLGKKDLSLILRYLFYKQEMNQADRNLLRRILLSIFEEEIICAGGKNFIHFLRLIEGKHQLEISDHSFLYFLVKGKGTVKSGPFTYNISSGSIFGQIQFILCTKIQSITFESSYILLALPEKQFNVFFIEYYQTKYADRLHHLQSIEQIYLKSLPELAKYILMKSLNFRKCSQGQKIVVLGGQVDRIYFISMREKYQQLKSKLPCLGLMQLLKGLTTYQDTFICFHKKMVVPYVKVEEFKTYVLDTLEKENNENSEEVDLRTSFLSLHPPEIPRQLPQLISFMRRKKVRISLTKSRLKTEPEQYFEANFAFLKLGKTNQNLRYKHLTEKKIERSFSRENRSYFSKRKD